jgi:type I restriction enzyme R subunit
MNETETRAEYIDPALKAAGWGVVEGSRIRMEFPINKGRLIGHGQRSKPDKADYILQYKNRNLAVIEAKARDKYYTEGVGQAKSYAERLQVRFTYSTNGLQIYGVDMQTGTEGDLNSYPTPDELWELTYPKSNDPKAELAEAWREKLLAVPFEDRSGTWQPRYYQENAITKVLEAISENEPRLLLTLATGTGKTAIAFQIAWKLFQAKWSVRQAQRPPSEAERSPRILFLADRNILADQAFNAFSAFEEDALVRINPADIKKKGRVPRNGSVFFTIFQTFMSGPNDTPYFGEYPEDFFDFIIIDECHRGGANDESSWRAIMEYFSPAVQLGLTATPKRTINADTYDYFGEPVYVYSLKEGINDGFLTPFKVKQIDTTIDEYIFTDDDTVLEGEIEEGKRYTEAEINRIIEIKEREDYRVKIFMSLINQSEKTLVFCATQLHALAIRDLINQYHNSSGTGRSRSANYCHRVTADDGKLGEQHLRDFQDNEKNIPAVLTTSQKLSTGVDAPEVRNIVLLRPVNSMIEFKQIIGRGTRLFDGKDYFTIFDFVKAHHHFSDSEWDGEPLEPEPPVTRPQPQPCDVCGKWPCICVEEPPPEPCPVCGYTYCRCGNPPRRMTKVKLADGKVRQFQHMVSTSFWSPDGKPISAEEFLRSLFGTLPELFKNEDELRTIWSKPDTRKKLLEELTEKGFAKQQLQEFQRILNAENSDLYDVLAYIAFQSSIVERQERAERAKIHFNDYDPKQQEFLNFVLSQYVKQGVDELDDTKLGDLLILKYNAIGDAKKELGDIPTIRETFIGFQTYLYDKRAAI